MNVSIDSWYRGLIALVVPQYVPQEIGDESRIIALEIGDVESGIKGPIILVDEEHLTDCAVTSCDYARS
jgi:hypothetical protein